MIFFCLLEYSLSGHKNMIMKINPDILKAKHLRIWYNAGGRLTNNQVTTTTQRPVAEGSDIEYCLIVREIFCFSTMENNCRN